LGKLKELFMSKGIASFNESFVNNLIRSVLTGYDTIEFTFQIVNILVESKKMATIQDTIIESLT